MIKKNDVVSIEYTLKDAAGQVIDTSVGQDPLEYLHGHGSIIEGLEKELEGKSINDEFSVKVSPEQGYGTRDEEMIEVVPIGNFPQPDELEVGGQVMAETEEGPVVFTVMKVEKDSVTLDGNHPLADQELHFEIKVVATREASADEIAQGHLESESSDN
jgi:FKBP-type peptidyl-prolyl cis-trans isomerase SlyD